MEQNFYGDNVKVNNTEDNSRTTIISIDALAFWSVVIIIAAAGLSVIGFQIFSEWILGIVRQASTDFREFNGEVMAPDVKPYFLACLAIGFLLAILLVVVLVRTNIFETLKKYFNEEEDLNW